VEALVPEPLETAHPLVDRPQAAGVQAVQPLLARPADPDKTDLPQDPQVLGRLRLGHPQVPRQVGHRPLAAPQQHQDLPPLRLGGRVALAVPAGAARRCAGVVRAGRRTPCPAAAELPGAARREQCEPCAALDRSQSVAADTVPDDPRPYAVYLAWFAPGLT